MARKTKRGKTPFCACGCKRKVNWNGRCWSTYVKGHGRRGKGRKQLAEANKGKAPLCKCGCKGKVKWSRHGHWNTYINYHGRRGKTRHKKPIGKAPFCKCGCKKKVNWNEGKHRWNTYINYHQTRSCKFYKNQNKNKGKAPLCKCGCKGKVKWSNTNSCWNTYIKNHSNRGKKNPFWRHGPEVGYLIYLITQGTDLKYKDIPPELIELKRESLKLHRLIKKGA